MADWRGDEYYRIIRTSPVNAEELQFFRSQDSTRPWLDRADYSPVISPARMPHVEGEDEFLGRVLQTPDTIPHWLTILSNQTFPQPGKELAPFTSRLPAGPEHPDALTLFDLRHGVNGFRGVANGGLLCALLDEALAFVVELHKHTTSSSREQLFTARLNISYRRPVLTPDIVVAKAWLEKRNGRKWFVQGVLENSKGERCIDIDGLWVAVPDPQL